jgi:poly(A) polymerase
MAAPETKAVLAALTAAGQEVRFVGGCVRDAVAKRPVEDVDLATADSPETVMELLQAAGIKVVPTGLAHGTVTAVVGGRTFEITTLRVDVETFGRRARVAFTGDWVADAKRRDFTINALSCTPGGRVYDPFDGLSDLAHGRIRFVGRARERIEEDVLRLLRFFRFYATYGRPPPDKDALAACRALAHRLPELSGERVREELFRILLAPDPAGAMLLMRGERVLPHALPEAGDVGVLRAISWLAARALPADTVAPDPIRRLAALLDGDSETAERVADRLKLSNRERVRLVALMEPLALGPGADAAARERLLRRLGSGLFRDAVLLAWARELALAPHMPAERTQGWRDLLAAAGEAPKLFPLKGRDALALGIAPGPRVGALLAAVEGWWEDGGCTADRQACLEKLRALAGQDR